MSEIETASRKRKKVFRRGEKQEQQARQIINKTVIGILYCAKDPVVKRAAAWTLRWTMQANAVPLLIRAAKEEQYPEVMHDILLILRDTLERCKDEKTHRRISSFLLQFQTRAEVELL